MKDDIFEVERTALVYYQEVGHTEVLCEEPLSTKDKILNKISKKKKKGEEFLKRKIKLINHSKIIPLPSRMIFMYDTTSNYGQLYIYHKEPMMIIDNFDPKKVISQILLTFTDDPQTTPQNPVISLGYYSIRTRLCYGQVVSPGNPFCYFTDNMDFHLKSINYPLRGVMKWMQNPNMINTFAADENTYNIVDFIFGESLRDDIQVIHSKWRTDKQEGACVDYKINLSSFENGYTILRSQEGIKVKSDCYNFHNLPQGMQIWEPVQPSLVPEKTKEDIINMEQTPLEDIVEVNSPNEDKPNI